MHRRRFATSGLAAMASLLIVVPLAWAARQPSPAPRPERGDAPAAPQGLRARHFWSWGDPSRFAFGNLELRLGLDANPVLGVVTSPVNDLLRSQLRLPEHQGLVVTSVLPGSAAAKAGIQVHDILLSIDGQPLASAASLTQAIRAAREKEKEVKVELMRSGERMEVAVATEAMARPAAPSSILRPWRAERRGSQYRIGVAIADVGATLRDQLHLEEGQGVVVGDVVPDSPAAKAGIQRHDVLLQVDGKPLTGPEDLRRAVAESGGKELQIELLREGQRQTIAVKPEKQPAEVYLSWPPFLEMEVPSASVPRPLVEGFENSSRSLRSQLERMSKQIEALRRKVESLEGGQPEELPAKPPKEKGRAKPKEKERTETPPKPAEGARI